MKMLNADLQPPPQALSPSKLNSMRSIPNPLPPSKSVTPSNGKAPVSAKERGANLDRAIQSIYNPKSVAKPVNSPSERKRLNSTVGATGQENSNRRVTRGMSAKSDSLNGTDSDSASPLKIPPLRIKRNTTSEWVKSSTTKRKKVFLDGSSSEEEENDTKSDKDYQPSGSSANRSSANNRLAAGRNKKLRKKMFLSETSSSSSSSSSESPPKAQPAPTFEKKGLKLRFDRQSLQGSLSSPQRARLSNSASSRQRESRDDSPEIICLD